MTATAFGEGFGREFFPPRREVAAGARHEPIGERILQTCIIKRGVEFKRFLGELSRLF